MTARPDPVVSAYSRLADRYIELFARTDAVHRDDLALIERHLGHVGGRVIDLGCGPGHLTAFMRGVGVDAVGVDPVPEFIEHARSAHPDGEFELATLHDLSARGAQATGLLVWYSLIHTPPDEFEAALGALADIIDPGGTVVIGGFDGPEVAPFDHKVTTAYTWPSDHLAARLDAVGFDELERLTRPADGDHRAHLAIAARRVP